MKLVERELGLEIELKENIVSVIVVENISMRLPLIEELYSQSIGKDGNWLLVENEKRYDLSKKAEVILEPFSLDLNNKKVKTKLYQEIKTVAQEYMFSQGVELHSDICKYLETVFEKLPYPIKYEQEWNVLELLKAYGVELVEECDSVCEKLFHYIKLLNELCGIHIFVAVNLKQYLTKDQLFELYKMEKYIKIQLVLIESCVQTERMEGEEVYILDEDRCIITY